MAGLIQRIEDRYVNTWWIPLVSSLVPSALYVLIFWIFVELLRGRYWASIIHVAASMVLVLLSPASVFAILAALTQNLFDKNWLRALANAVSFPIALFVMMTCFFTADMLGGVLWQAVLRLMGR